LADPGDRVVDAILDGLTWIADELLGQEDLAWQQVLPTSFVGDLDLLWIHGGDLHGEIAGELLEVVAASYEICLTVDFDEDADAASAVNVGLNQTLLRQSIALLVSDDGALSLQDFLGAVEVAAGLG